LPAVYRRTCTRSTTTAQATTTAAIAATTSTSTATATAVPRTVADAHLNYAIGSSSTSSNSDQRVAAHRVDHQEAAEILGEQMGDGDAEGGCLHRVCTTTAQRYERA
jgi:hypothetical protein